MNERTKEAVQHHIAIFNVVVVLIVDRRP
jgi:hypothetical protein